MSLATVSRLVAAFACCGILALAAEFHTSAAASTLVPGNLLVLDAQDGNGHGLILQVDRHTGAQSVWQSGGYLHQPTDMVYDGRGNIIVSGNSESGPPGELIRISLATGQQTLVSQGGWLSGTASLAVESGGTYLAASEGPLRYPFSPNIVRVDPVTGVQNLVMYAEAWSGSPISSIGRMILAPDGNVLLTNAFYDDGVSGIFNVNAVTGAVSSVSTGGFFGTVGPPKALRLNPSDLHHLFVTDPSSLSPNISGLLDVNLDTGSQTMLSTGGLLQAPFAVNMSELGDLFVSNLYRFGKTVASLVEVNPTTGTQTLISSGESLITPVAILVIPTPEPASGVLLVVGGVLLLFVSYRRPGRASSSKRD
jgi:hypothetical protein